MVVVYNELAEAPSVIPANLTHQDTPYHNYLFSTMFVAVTERESLNGKMLLLGKLYVSYNKTN